MTGLGTKPSRSALIDAGLVLVALGLHLGGAFLLDLFPADRPFEYVVVGVPAIVLVAALVLLYARSDRRGLQAACLVQWLLVLYTLPAKFAGLAFVPSAVILSLALLRPVVAATPQEAAAQT
jgi:hypothetical protein